ncbi:putative reverse transcriptase domain-containing protein [Tanacetum coccineum]
MPPRRFKKKSVKRLVEKHVAKAIEEYKKNRANLDSAGSSGGTLEYWWKNMTWHGCSHKTFMNGKPHTFNGMEGVVGLRRWIEKVEQVFETCKCAEEIRLCLLLVLSRVKEELKGSLMGFLKDSKGWLPDIVESNKRKWEDHQRNNNNNNNNRNRNNNYHQQQNRRQETARAYAAAPTENRGYAGNLPKCNRCNFHHSGRCPPKCQKCQRTGHLEKDCRAILPGACNDFLQNATCYGCGEKGHLKNKCPKAGNQHNEGARARAYVVVENPQQNPNVVTGTFLLNDHYACILFDSGAEKSFVSSAFTPFINIAPATLNTSYEVELADGKVVSTNTILRSCTLVLCNHVFKIDLLPTRLGSFDVIIGMDWLAYHRALIDCYEKIVRIPLPNGKILEVQGERPEKDLDYLNVSVLMRKCLMTYAHRQLLDLHTVSPFRMLELSNTTSKIFKRRVLYATTKSLTWESPMLFVKKKDGAMRMYDWTQWSHFFTRREDSKMEKVGKEFISTRLWQDMVCRCQSFQTEMVDSRHTYGNLFRKTLRFNTSENAMLIEAYNLLNSKLGTRVLLKVSPWIRIVNDLEMKGNLAHGMWGERMEIVECVGLVAYRLKLPQELSCVHYMFHVSNLEKCLAEPDVQVPLDEMSMMNLRLSMSRIEIHPIVTIPLLPDFGGVTDGTRAKTRADSNNDGGSGSTNTGGTVVPEMHGCSYKTFMNGKPHSFKGTEGVVGLKRWFEKMEQVFEICKCAEDDKVKFAMCTFEGRALKSER